MTDHSVENALEYLLNSRFSCRAFLPDAVPRSTQRQLLALAQGTASWCNAQPWQVHIAEGAATERFREVMLAPLRHDEPGPDFAWPEEYAGIYRDRRRDCAAALYESVGIARDDREGSNRQTQENFRFFGAPHVAMVSTEAGLGTYGAVDCGGYVANFLLAAASLGIATIPQAAVALRPQRVRDFFGLAANRLVVCGISFGLPNMSHPANGFRTERASVDAAATWLMT